MALAPHKRLTATQALQHELLALGKEQRSRGKEALRQAFA
jgi:hypothetical protein